LEHQYTPAELSFSTLKNIDAARASALLQAANRANCEIYLGIIHIEESGSAELNYESYSRRSRWRRWQSDDSDESKDYDTDFKVIEPIDIEQYIDTWIDPENRARILGKIPLNEGELSNPDMDWYDDHIYLKPIEPKFIEDLWDTLDSIENAQTLEKAVREIISNPKIFDPPKVLIPALLQIEHEKDALQTNHPFISLWNHAAEYLLSRSEFPHEKPKDRSQEVSISCRCDDCKELQLFARAPDEKVCRFRVRKDRRQHLHQTIEKYKLDMTHETERIGSPQTLVCTKTLRTYEMLCEMRRNDLVSMKSLLSLTTGPGPLRDRLNAAIKKK